jgi:predicted HicB family RNase H-like nuclease
MPAKKKGKKDMLAAVEPTLKPVRLDLSPEVHRMLRLVAAHEDVSMAAFARDSLEALLREEVKRRGIKV